MLTAWPRPFTAWVAASTSSTVMPATKRLERRLPMEVFSAIARMDVLSDNQMKKGRSKLTFVHHRRQKGHVTEVIKTSFEGARIHPRQSRCNSNRHPKARWIRAERICVSPRLQAWGSDALLLSDSQALS